MIPVIFMFILCLFLCVKENLRISLNLKNILMITVVVVQLLSHDQLFATPWTAACQAPLFFTISQSLLKLMSIELVVLYNQLMLCHPLFLWLPIFLSFRVYSSELALHIRWTLYVYMCMCIFLLCSSAGDKFFQFLFV